MPCEDPFAAATTERFASDPLAAQRAAQTLLDIKKGKHAKWLVDIFFQKDSRGGGIGLVEADAFNGFASNLFSGKLKMVGIQTAGPPGADEDRAGNNAKISDLPRPFTAKFFGGSGDNDGFLEWTAAAFVNHFDCELKARPGYQCRKHAAKLRPGFAPLEVGTTTAATTFMHLCFGPLARWPYGSEAIFLLVPMSLGLPMVDQSWPPTRRRRK